MFRRKVIAIPIIAAMLATGWAVLFFGGMAASRWIAGKFGSILQKAADGKFSDPVVFVHGRLHEAMYLASAAFLIGLAVVFCYRLFRKVDRWRPVHGLAGALICFAAINLFAWCCGKTVIFWSLFYSKTRVDNLAQYHIKRALMEDFNPGRRAILLGNSQTNRSIDERVLNSILGKSLWTTELTQAGARGFDMLTLSRDIPLRKGDTVVCYVSEICFYGRGSGIVASDFLNFREIPVLNELHGWKLIAPGAARNGLLGRVLPVYRYRNSVTSRVLGGDLTGMQQRFHDALQATDLGVEAEKSASRLGSGEGSIFEQAAFLRMCGELEKNGCRFVIIAGDVHPELEKRISPEVAEDMDRFFRTVETTYPGSVTLIDGSTLLHPDAETFMDLVHFTEEARSRFSRALAPMLDEIATAKDPAAPGD